jgi:prepilin-type processing-associated H-X9-DG protein
MSTASQAAPKSSAWKLLVLFAFVVMALYVIVDVFAPSGPTRIPATTCANHLKQLGGVLLTDKMSDGKYPSEGGAAVLLGMRQGGAITAGNEGIFTCPGDPDASTPRSEEDSAAYASVDLADVAAIASMCSFAVRDFAGHPVAMDDDEAWIACDRQGKDGRTPHHEGGLNVLFSDGSVKFMDRAALGLGESDPIVVGPDSPHPELKKMIFALKK